MKTAMIKTNLWDDDEFYELNIDTKIVYLLLLTAPERGVGRIYKMSDRIISARSGLNVDQVNLCKKQLTKKKLVNFVSGWVQLAENSSFVQPVKGKLTAVTLERELKEIPEEVLQHFIKLTDETSPVKHVSPTRETPVLVNDNVHDNDIVNDTVFGKSEVNDLFEYWKTNVGYAIEGNRQRNRNACNNLLKKYSKKGVEQLINAVGVASNDKYAPRISDFVSLQAKLNDLLAWAKKKGTTNAIARF